MIMKYLTAGSNHICRREAIVYSLGFALATIIAINCMSYERDAVGQQIPLQPFFNNSDTNTAIINDINNNNILDLQSQALNKLFKQIEGSVVEINVDLGNGTGASGSGFIYNTDGYIITNNHVVDGAIGGKVDVTFLDGNTYTAKVVGTDLIEDVGVIQI